jgi:AbrB family looped-hinge helix DNA binding protein
MPISTVSSKGQITLPKRVRERLGVRTGDRVAFRERADGSIVIEADKADALALFGMLKPRRRGVTLADMDDAIGRGSSRK